MQPSQQPSIHTLGHPTTSLTHTSTYKSNHTVTQSHTDAQKQPNIYITFMERLGLGTPPGPQYIATQGKGYPNTRRTTPWGNNPRRMQIVRPAVGLVINQSGCAAPPANKGVSTECAVGLRTAATRRGGGGGGGAITVTPAAPAPAPAAAVDSGIVRGLRNSNHSEERSSAQRRGAWGQTQALGD